MKISTRNVGDVKILDVSGKITLGEDTAELRNEVKTLLKNGQKKIVLNLADVNYIDSSGLGELVSCHVTADSQGAKLKLLNLTKKLRELMAITKLLTVFETYEDEASALASFK
ncbi:MAG: STAS domain-containing protein [Acidobacteria bacterium]|nr:STAS domain-containing protein [Acidobacteriota bacterium]MBI3657004.1 STAS domain-containing protein [Acidobacteriota bacterium]